MTYKKPKPQIRNGKEVEIRSDLANMVHKYLAGANAYKNCLNCENWDFDNDQCGKFKSKPPTDIIVNSCPEYVDDEEVPF